MKRLVFDKFRKVGGARITVYGYYNPTKRVLVEFEVLGSGTNYMNGEGFYKRIDHEDNTTILSYQDCELRLEYTSKGFLLVEDARELWYLLESVGFEDTTIKP